MIIKIFSRQQAVKQSYTNFDGSKIIISISDPSEKKAKFNRNNISIKSVLYLSFYDIDEKTKSIFGGYDSMSPIDAVLIRDFVLKWENYVDEIWVQCEMGISRSAGIAAAISEHFELDSTDILNNKKYIPNILCYNLTKDAFSKKRKVRLVCFFILKEMPLYLLNSDTGVILFLQCFIDFVEYKLIGIIAIITKDAYTAFFQNVQGLLRRVLDEIKKYFFT